MRQVDRQRHELRRLVAGVAEHQALVAGALVQRIVLRLVYALLDVGRLLVVGHQHGAAFVVDAELGVVVADALDGVARDLLEIHRRSGGDLAGHHDQAGVDQRFRRHAGVFVLG